MLILAKPLNRAKLKYCYSEGLLGKTMIEARLETSNATLNPFDKKDGKDPERIEDIDLEVDPKMVEVLDLFFSISLGRFDLYKNLYSDKKTGDPLNAKHHERIGDLHKIVLNPISINTFMQFALVDSRYDAKYTGYSRDRVYPGRFISQLIVNSYREGNNDFVLNFPRPLAHVDYLRGDKNNEIKLTVRGQLGKHLASNSRNLIINVDAKAPLYLASNIKNSTIRLRDEYDFYTLKLRELKRKSNTKIRMLK